MSAFTDTPTSEEPALAGRPEPIPVTLLSGFLGAGKTTLLKKILQGQGHGMKIAVIVNDMGALNIDAEEIAQHKLVKEKSQMVEFHHGCICCTLRGDLLKTVKDLSEEVDEAGEPAWEYIVIESTGISEPLPIAQTFVMDVAACGPTDVPAAQDFVPLSKHARLDTLVTVVDLYNVLHVLCGDEDAPGERERLLGGDDEEELKEAGKPASLYQLLVDQLEFANIILLNKVDLVHPEDPEARFRQVMMVCSLVRKFNSCATILVPGYEFDFTDAKPTGGNFTKSKFADFDVAQVVDTGLFDMERAQRSAGWIRELQNDHTPETEEYGIGSFVWRMDREDPRPFHPARLKHIMREGQSRGPLCADVQTTAGFLLYSCAKRLCISTATRCGSRNIECSSAPKCGDTKKKTAGGFGSLPKPNPGPKRQKKPFVGVVRSKGHLWLAYAHAIRIEFHTAGRQVSLAAGMPFLDAVPRKYWSEGSRNSYEESVKTGRWHGVNPAGNGVGFGDRSSVLVIIGVGLTAERKQVITKALNSALLTDTEMAAGVKAFKEGSDDHPWRKFADPLFGGQGPEKMWKLDLPSDGEGDQAEQSSSGASV